MASNVPQGSVLGPIFVNDIPSIVSSPTLLFADDTKMFRIVKIVMTTLHSSMI